MVLAVLLQSLAYAAVLKEEQMKHIPREVPLPPPIPPSSWWTVWPLALALFAAFMLGVVIGGIGVDRANRRSTPTAVVEELRSCIRTRENGWTHARTLEQERNQCRAALDAMARGGR